LQVGDIVNWSVRIRTCILFLQTIKRLLELLDTDVETINRSHETALDTAQKMGNAEVARLLSERGVVSALLGSTVGSCWDQPSALAGIDRRLLLESTVGSCWDRPSELRNARTLNLTQ
jgi:hypothetical protein